MALVLACAAVAAGRFACLPFVALVGSFAVQTHLGLVPVVFGVTGVALAAAAMSSYRSGDPGEWPRFRRTLNIAAWALLASWLLPIAQQLHGDSGNLTALWTFFAVEDHEGQTFRDAFTAWADMMSGVFRPDFYVAWGGRLRRSQSVLSQPWAVAQVLLLGATAVLAGRRGDTARAALAGLLAFASVAALWSVTRIEDDLVDHAVFWMAGLGVLGAAVLIDAAATPLLRRWRPSVRVAAVVCGALWLAAAAAGFQQMRVVVSRSYRPGIEQLAARRLTDALREWMSARDIGKPLVRIDQPTWGIAAGVLLQLQKQGVPFAVERDWISMFTPAVAAAGDETSILTFAGPERRYRLLNEPGHQVIAERGSVSIVLEAGSP
jgi:hypothetical protein